MRRSQRSQCVIETVKVVVDVKTGILSLEVGGLLRPLVSRRWMDAETIVELMRQKN